jgi:hypothetical protein
MSLAELRVGPVLGDSAAEIGLAFRREAGAGEHHTEELVLVPGAAAPGARAVGVAGEREDFAGAPGVSHVHEIRGQEVGAQRALLAKAAARRGEVFGGELEGVRQVFQALVAVAEDPTRFREFEGFRRGFFLRRRERQQDIAGFRESPLPLEGRAEQNLRVRIPPGTLSPAGAPEFCADSGVALRGGEVCGAISVKAGEHGMSHRTVHEVGLGMAFRDRQRLAAEFQTRRGIRAGGSEETALRKVRELLFRRKAPDHLWPDLGDFARGADCVEGEKQSAAQPDPEVGLHQGIGGRLGVERRSGLRHSLPDGGALAAGGQGVQAAVGGAGEQDGARVGRELARPFGFSAGAAGLEDGDRGQHDQRGGGGGGGGNPQPVPAQELPRLVQHGGRAGFDGTARKVSLEILGQFPDGEVAPRRLVLQALAENAAEVSRQTSHQGAEWRGPLLRRRRGNHAVRGGWGRLARRRSECGLHGRIRAERPAPGEQFIEHDAQRINVGGDADRRAA